MSVTTEIDSLRADIASLKSTLEKHFPSTPDSAKTQLTKTRHGSRHQPQVNTGNSKSFRDVVLEILDGINTRVDNLADRFKSPSGPHDRENEAALLPREPDRLQAQLPASSGAAPSLMDLDPPARTLAELHGGENGTTSQQESNRPNCVADEPASSPPAQTHEPAKAHEPESEAAPDPPDCLAYNEEPPAGSGTAPNLMELDAPTPTGEPADPQGRLPATSQPPPDAPPVDPSTPLQESDGELTETGTATSSAATPSTDATTVGEELAAPDNPPQKPVTRPDVQWSLPTVESPGLDEWKEFWTFYKRVSTHHEAAGFVLIEIPPSLMETSQSQPQVEITKSLRGTIHWKSEYVAQITPETVTHDPPITWEITPQPDGPQDPGSAFSEWWTEFGPQSSKASLPFYAADVEVSSARVRFGLPEKSPIYPLDGNILLESAPEAGGLTIPDGFISGAFGTVFTFHEEDFYIPALNINYRGCPTCWVVINKSQTRKLLTALQQDGLAVPTRRSCHQWPRHENLFFHPAYLEKNEIQYSCFLQPPGTAVLVLEGAGHYGFNLGPKLCEAVNYVPSGWEPPTVKECNCYGWPPIRREMLLPKSTVLSNRPASKAASKKRKTPSAGRLNPKRQMIEDKPSGDALTEEWKAYIMASGPDARFSTEVTKSRLWRHILNLWSRERIVQTCSAIKLWGQSSGIRDLCRNWRTGLRAQQIKNMEICRQRIASSTHLSSATEAIFGVHQTRKILEEYGSNGRLEHGALYSALDIPENDKVAYQRRYEQHRVSCKQDRLCGEYGLGLLIMIPFRREAPYHLSLKDYGREIHENEIPDFHRLLRTSKLFSAVCAMAGDLAQCILDGTDTTLRKWELSTDVEALRSMPEEKLLGLLAVAERAPS